VTRRHPVIALSASYFFFALMALLVRVLSLRGFGFAELATWRMVFGALACLPVLMSGRARFIPVRPLLILLRCVVGAVALLLYFYSIQHLELGLATLLNYLGPLFTTLFAAYFLSERTEPRTILGMAIALAGTALTVKAMPNPVLLTVGALAGLLSAVGQGAAVTVIRALRVSEGAVTIYFWFCIVTVASTLPLAWGHFHVVGLSGLPLIVGVGVSSLCAQLLLNDALGYVPASTGALVSPLMPAFAFGLGALVLGEPLTWRIVLAANVAIVGVILGTWRGMGSRAQSAVVLSRE
jgi:drug/metabolite transporter (DMT)-like permease